MLQDADAVDGSESHTEWRPMRVAEPRAPKKHLPVVAIAGAPNVGKSTIANRLTGSVGKKSKFGSMIFHESGITRDSVYGVGSWEGQEFVVIDTGGYGYVESDPFDDEVRKMAVKAVDAADAVLFLVDGKEGLTVYDEEFADILRKKGKPLVLAVNKCDQDETDIDVEEEMAEADERTYDFYALGHGEPNPISALDDDVRFSELMADLMRLLPEPSPDSDTVNGHVDADAVVNELRVAIIGQPNAGKSSLINQLLGEERQIVSNYSGTTREANKHSVTFDNTKFTFIDTAGVRNRSEVIPGIEERMVKRAWNAMRDEADVCLLMVDGSRGLEGLERQDGLLARQIVKAKCPCVVLINKWDLAPEHEENPTYKKEIGQSIRSRFMNVLKSTEPPLYISAKTGLNTDTIFNVVRSAASKAKVAQQDAPRRQR